MAYVALALIAAASLGAAMVYGLRARRLAGDAGQRALTAEARVADQRDEIQRKEAMLRGLVETSPAAMVLFTDSGRITFSNAAARALFFEDTDVEGQNFLTMLERAPEPLRRSLLSTGSELFTTEGPDGPAGRDRGVASLLDTVMPHPRPKSNHARPAGAQRPRDRVCGAA